jgi:hypothetical protein
VFKTRFEPGTPNKSQDHHRFNQRVLTSVHRRRYDFIITITTIVLLTMTVSSQSIFANFIKDTS